MIRVGKGKPKIQFHGIIREFPHHVYPPAFIYNDWFWMSLTDYAERYEFEHFNISPNFSKKQFSEIQEGLAEDSILVSWENELKILINKAKGQTVWEYNVTPKDLNGYMRTCSVLGKPSLCRWTWFDAYIKFYICKSICWLLNKFKIAILMDYLINRKVT